MHFLFLNVIISKPLPYLFRLSLLTSFLSLCADCGFLFLIRRLSQRPTAEELEQRNILKREYLKLVYLTLHS